MKFGEADVLARAKNTSVEKLASMGLVYAEKASSICWNVPNCRNSKSHALRRIAVCG